MLQRVAQVRPHPVLASQGLTYSTLVEEARLSKARALLEDADIPMIDIAWATGYRDPSHFSRAFRRMAGVTPSTYRKWLASGALVSNAQAHSV